MEYVVGPLVALALGMKFTAMQQAKCEKKYDEVMEKVSQMILDEKAETSKKVLQMMTPAAVAIKRLNEEVGIQ